MVRFKSRYMLITLHYPVLPDTEDIIPDRPQSEYYLSRFRSKTNVPLSDGNILPGGREGNLSQDLRALLDRRPSPKAVDLNAVSGAIRHAINRDFGDLGAGLVRASISLKYFSQATSTGILRVSRDHVQTVWAALTLLTEIEGISVVVSVDHVSGTMRKCEQFAKSANLKLIAHIDRESQST